MFDNTFSGRRVLVTGDTGFKGSWLCQWLLQLGAEVFGCGLTPTTTPSLFELLELEGQYDHRTIDIRDQEKVAAFVAESRPDIVLHLAAQPLVRLSYQQPKETFDTNVMGTLHVLEAVRQQPDIQACVVISSDKCYENREWVWGYREQDPLGGKDPYSASKAATEIVTASYRDSFFRDAGATCVASARAGNVIGGGDWAQDRIVPDFVSSILAEQPLVLRKPNAIRPWQHVLEPLSGYLALASRLCGADGTQFASGWNFGPSPAAHVTVGQLAKRLVATWGAGEVRIDPAAAEALPESGILKLDCSKAISQLAWQPNWDFATTIQATVEWYRSWSEGADMRDLTRQQIKNFEHAASTAGAEWADQSRQPHHSQRLAG
ncbi:CDP-glucose 4,6-dehydratase [Rosistilla carotiformis]|uniref:CDP-glucose 4,6-dehydratase n=1 Tax=Rosistilla carotiformis TaxID=2528017 RepID=A0A518JQ05_9BACT|nr:CDP-glucose 4,6-dehydratase [Rosistilla carotiformis]QDV67629.1 CDP-glucose 4,6-dehydratase [Rosistilla carotiformis]